MSEAIVFRILYVLSLLAMALGPFYIWKSGIPQLAHCVMAIAIGLHLCQGSFRWRRWWSWLFLFATYTLVVNIIVYTLFRDTHSLYSSFYYLFNASVFVHVAILAERAGRERFLRSVSMILWLLLTLEFVLVLTSTGRVFNDVRVMGTFNDPNQLANWVIFVALCLSAIGRVLRGSWLYRLLAVGLAFVVVAFSASRSGALGLLVILVIVGFLGAVEAGLSVLGRRVFRLRSIAGVLGLLILCVAGLGVVALMGKHEIVSGPVLGLWEATRNWLGRFSESSPWMTWEGRGYDRLWKFPEYLVFGAGEGANQRWAEATWFLGEIHSTPAGVVFYYGIVGTSFLLLFVFHLVSKLGNLWFKLMLIAPVAYSVGTYNLRNWFLWLGMAILYVAAIHARHSRETNCGRKSDRSASHGEASKLVQVVGGPRPLRN